MAIAVEGVVRLERGDRHFVLEGQGDLLRVYVSHWSLLLQARRWSHLRHSARHLARAAPASIEIIVGKRPFLGLRPRQSRLRPRFLFRRFFKGGQAPPMLGDA